MKPNIRRMTGILISIVGLTALASLTGCSTPKPPPAAASEAPRDSVTKAAAIQNAQRDAAYRYSEVAVSRVDARRAGGYWVVELTGASGAGLRYTISALDGSIRARNMFQ